MDLNIMPLRLYYMSILIVIGAGMASISHADDLPTTPTKAERMAATITLRSLNLKLTDSHYEEGVHRGRQVAGFTGASGNITIDQETGIVVDYMTDSIPISSETESPQISSEKAISIGLAFLRRSGIEPEGVWTLTDNKYHEVSSSFRQYNLAWHRLFNGVELPSFIIISINADDGRIISYHLVDDPITIPLQANITGEQALVAVSERKEWLHPIVRKVNLSIWYPNGYPGSQALMWRLEIANPDAKTGINSYVWADVNATTGEIIRLREPAGFFGPMPKGKKMVSVILPKPNLKALRYAKLPPTVFQLAAQRKKAK